LRVTVPADLVVLIGRREIHRSLRVTDPRIARSVSRTALRRAEETFATLRQQRLAGASQETLVSTARAFYAEQLPSTRSSVVLRVAYGSSGGNCAPQSLSEAIEAFAADRSSRWEPKTRLMHGASLALFVQVVGNKPVAVVTRQDCRSFRDTLAQLPPNLTKRFKGMSLAEVLARKPAPMSPKNANRILSAVTALFGWCEREGLISDSPARGLMLQINRRPDTERNVFTADQLQLVFARLTPSMGTRFWLPAIAVYSGMRLEEIAQLRPVDVREVGGILCFDINADGGKRLKTASSARLVPVHPRLIEIGLAEMIAGCSSAATLWPDLSRGADGFYSSPFSKWFGRFKRAAGIVDARVTFHSFRHTFVNALKQAGVEELVIRELVGHANTSITTGRYGKRLEPARLAEAVQLLSFRIDVL
jgi:integrase